MSTREFLSHILLMAVGFPILFQIGEWWAI